MPPKKTQNNKSSTSRTRSKSLGRADKSRSRSRSRSRVTAAIATPPRRNKSRQAASESKATRRRPSRSPSLSESPAPSPAVLRPRKPKRLDSESGKRRQTLAAQVSEMKQELLRKIEIEVDRKSPIASHTRSRDSTMKPCCANVAVNAIQHYICESSVIQALIVMLMIPFVYWVNLLVFAPHTSASTVTIWGQAKPFAWVLWPTDWRVYFNVYVFFGVLTFFVFHLLLAVVLPLGSHVDKRVRYRSNGIFSFILTSVLLAAAQWGDWSFVKAYRPGNQLPKNLLSMITASSVYALVLGVASYFGSKKASPSQLAPNVPRSRSFLSDFFGGRMMRPTLLGVDWKLFMLRVAHSGMLLVDVLFVLASFTLFAKISPALVIMVMMRAVWVVDFLLFERSYQSTFGVAKEPFGFALIVVQLVVIPFFYTIGSAFAFSRPDLGSVVLRSSLEMVYLTYAAAFVLFVVGYYIFRASNLQKSSFKLSSFSSSSAVVVGPDSHRLLCSGLWGVVRHPNYLGDLMMSYAASIPAGFSSVFPWLLPLFLTLFYAHRISCIEAASYEHHRAVWLHYARLVPNKLIPRIF